MSDYSIDDLLYLMSRLRDPDTGCPWDIKQDFASIVPHTLEEAYEVADTIERQDWPHLNDELGDLLFQVIFYAQLGKESGSFAFDSIVDNLVSKLIRRHPHVFPDGTLRSQRDGDSIDEATIKRNWELIKQQERSDKEISDEVSVDEVSVDKESTDKEKTAKSRVLDDIPKALPALNRAVKLQKRASQVGFDWNDAELVLDKIEEEAAELREAIREGNQDAVADEMGDLIFAQVNLARHLQVNPESALRGTNQKFERRFGYVEEQVLASGREWQAFTLDELDAFWDQAKSLGL